MYKLVVFDLDGTLADTIKDLSNAVNNSLKENNLPTHSLESYNQFVGNGVDRLIELALMDKCGDRELFKVIKDGFRKNYRNHICDYTTAYEGVDKLLSELENRKIITGVLSNKPHEYVSLILKRLYPDHNFKYEWGQRAEYKRKPSGDALCAMINDCGVAKEKTLYVGDSDVDVMTAHNAGVKVCGVDWGFRGREELKTAGADYIVSNCTELLNIIQGKQ